MNRFLAIIIAMAILVPAGKSFAGEKSLWQKFVDFFNPSPTLEGEGPIYDELKELDQKISKTEGKYSRERRPGNKTRLKKELEELRAERERLVERIKAGEGQAEKPKSSAAMSSAKSSAASSSSSGKSAPASSAQAAPTASAASACVHDTVFVRDTVVIHDTLYVIVADKPAAAPADTTQALNKN